MDDDALDRRTPTPGESALTGLADAIETGSPGAPLLVDRDLAVLRRGDLARQLSSTAIQLRSVGIGPNDIVCVALTNGPRLATAMLALVSSVVCAPLNPRSTEREYEVLFADLEPSALVTIAGTSPDAERAARSIGMGLFELVPGDDPFTFGLSCVEPPVPRARRMLDAAVCLHTSGTTARPKLVALDETQLLHTAGEVGATLALGAGDRCLNVMPLFHIHGIVAGLLASVVAGGEVMCAPGFDAFSFQRDLVNGSCSWTTAVPSMYQAVARRRVRTVRPHPELRVLRSSSAPLHDVLAAALEERFGCPVVNSYGMTEAAHQMASQRLPPAPRRRGTVGAGAGAEIALLQDGAPGWAAGRSGEVVVRGPGVIAAYVSPCAANDESHVDGWFRTGDEGILGEDGDLTLVGRIKELINVAGEKVSPYEVEEVLQGHPSVAQAASFAMPDQLRGERVHAAVVLVAGDHDVTARDLRAFVRDRLSPHKVPDEITFVETIPLGPTGKIQRTRLPELLELDLDFDKAD